MPLPPMLPQRDRFSAGPPMLPGQPGVLDLPPPQGETFMPGGPEQALGAGPGQSFGAPAPAPGPAPPMAPPPPMAPQPPSPQPTPLPMLNAEPPPPVANPPEQSLELRAPATTGNMTASPMSMAAMSAGMGQSRNLRGVMGGLRSY